MADPQINLGDLGTLDSFFDLFKQLTDHLNKHVATITKKIQNVTNIMDQGAKATNVSTIENNINKVNTKLKAFNAQVQKIVQDAYNQVDTLEKTVKNVAPTGGVVNIKAKFTEVSNRLSKTLATRTEELFKNVTKEIESSLGTAPAGQQFSSRAIREISTKPLEKALQDKLTKTIDLSLKRYKESLNKVAENVKSVPLDVSSSVYAPASTVGYVQSEGKFISEINKISDKRIQEHLDRRDDALKKALTKLKAEQPTTTKEIFPYQKLRASSLGGSDTQVRDTLLRASKNQELVFENYIKRFGGRAAEMSKAVLEEGTRVHNLVQAAAEKGWTPPGLAGSTLIQTERAVADVETGVTGSMDLLYKKAGNYVVTELKSLNENAFTKLNTIIKTLGTKAKPQQVTDAILGDKSLSYLGDNLQKWGTQVDAYRTFLGKEMGLPIEQINKQIQGAIYLISRTKTGAPQAIQVPYAPQSGRLEAAIEQGKRLSKEIATQLKDDPTIKTTLDTAENRVKVLEEVNKLYVESKQKAYSDPGGASESDLLKVTAVSAKLKGIQALVQANRARYGAAKKQQGDVAGQAINAISSLAQVQEIDKSISAFAGTTDARNKFLSDLTQIAKGTDISKLKDIEGGVNIASYGKANTAIAQLKDSIHQFIGLRTKQKAAFSDPNFGIQNIAKEYSGYQSVFKNLIDSFGDPKSLDQLRDFVSKAGAGKTPGKTSIEFPESAKVRGDIEKQLQRLGPGYTSFIETYYDARAQQTKSILHIINEDVSKFSNLKTEAEKQTALTKRFGQSSFGGAGVVSSAIGVGPSGQLEGASILKKSVEGLEGVFKTYANTGRNIMRNVDDRTKGLSESINEALTKKIGVTTQQLRDIGRSTGEIGVGQSYVKGGDTALAIESSQVGLGKNFIPQVEKEMNKEFSTFQREELQNLFMNPRTGIISGMFNSLFDNYADKLNFKDLFSQLKFGKSKLYKTKTTAFKDPNELKAQIKEQMLARISTKLEKVIFSATSQGDIFQGSLETFVTDVINKNIFKGAQGIPDQLGDYMQQALKGVVDFKRLFADSSVYDTQTANIARSRREAGETISRTISTSKAGSQTKLFAEKGESGLQIDRIFTELSKAYIRRSEELEKQGIEATEKNMRASFETIAKQVATIVERKSIGVYDKGEALRLGTGEGGRLRFTTDTLVNQAYNQMGKLMSNLVAGRGVGKEGQIQAKPGGLHPDTQAKLLERTFDDKKFVGFEGRVSAVSGADLVKQQEDPQQILKMIKGYDENLAKGVQEFLSKSIEQIKTIVKIDPKTNQFGGLRSEFVTKLRTQAQNSNKEAFERISRLTADQLEQLAQYLTKTYGTSLQSRYTNYIKGTGEGESIISDPVQQFKEAKTPQFRVSAFKEILSKIQESSLSRGKGIRLTKEGTALEKFDVISPQIQKDLTAITDAIINKSKVDQKALTERRPADVERYDSVFKDLQSATSQLRVNLISAFTGRTPQVKGAYDTDLKGMRTQIKERQTGIPSMIQELDTAFGSVGQDLLRYSKEGKASYTVGKTAEGDLISKEMDIPKSLAGMVKKFNDNVLRPFHDRYMKASKEAETGKSTTSMERESNNFVQTLQTFVTKIGSQFGLGSEDASGSLSSFLRRLNSEMSTKWSGLLKQTTQVTTGTGEALPMKSLISSNFSAIEGKVQTYIAQGINYRNAVFKALVETFSGEAAFPKDALKSYQQKSLDMIKTKTQSRLGGSGQDIKFVEKSISQFTQMRKDVPSKVSPKDMTAGLVEKLQKADPGALFQRILNAYYQQGEGDAAKAARAFGESPTAIAKQLSSGGKGADPSKVRNELVQTYIKQFNEYGVKLDESVIKMVSERIQKLFESIIPGSFVDEITGRAKKSQARIQAQYKEIGMTSKTGAFDKSFMQKTAGLYKQDLKPSMGGADPRLLRSLEGVDQGDVLAITKPKFDASVKYKEESTAVKGTAQEVRNLTDLLREKVGVIGMESNALKEEPALIQTATGQAAKLSDKIRDGFKSTQEFNQGLVSIASSANVLASKDFNKLIPKGSGAKFATELIDPLKEGLVGIEGAAKKAFTAVKPDAGAVSKLIDNYNNLARVFQNISEKYAPIMENIVKAKGLKGFGKLDMFGDKDKEQLTGAAAALDKLKTTLEEIGTKARVPLKITDSGAIEAVTKGMSEKDAEKALGNLDKAYGRMAGKGEIVTRTNKEMAEGIKPFDKILKDIVQTYKGISATAKTAAIPLGERLEATTRMANQLKEYEKEVKNLHKAEKQGLIIPKKHAALIKENMIQMKSQISTQQQRIKMTMDAYGDNAAVSLLKSQLTIEEQVNNFRARGIQLQGQLAQFNKTFPDMKRKELLVAEKITDQYGKQIGSLEQLVRVQGKNSMYMKDQVKGLYAGGPAQIMGNVMKRMAMYSGGGFAYFGILRLVKGIIKTITDVELGMMKLRQIMDHTTTDFRGMITAAVGISKAYGTELSKVVDVMNDYARMGLKAAEVTKMTEVAVMGVNVGFKDTRTAMDFLTSMIKQYNMEVSRSVDILDMLVEVADRNATTVEDLGQAFKHTGAAAFAAGVKIEELIAMIATLEANTRLRGSMIGRALRRIISRVHSEEAVSMLENMGVAVYDVSGQYRSFTTILGDVADRWKSLTNVQQENLARQIAQQRYYNFFIVLMNKWNETMVSVNQAQNSQGAAMRKNAEIMQSLSKHTAITKQIFAEFSVTLGDAGILNVLKGIQDAVQVFAKTLSVIPGPLKTILGLVIGIKVMQMGLNWQLRLFTGKGLTDWFIKLKGIAVLSSKQVVDQGAILASTIKNVQAQEGVNSLKMQEVGIGTKNISLSAKELALRQAQLDTELLIVKARHGQTAATQTGMAYMAAGGSLGTAAAGGAGIVSSQAAMASMTQTAEAQVIGAKAAAGGATVGFFGKIMGGLMKSVKFLVTTPLGLLITAVTAGIGIVTYRSYKDVSRTLKDIQEETQGTISFVTKSILDAQTAIGSIKDIQGATKGGGAQEIAALEKQGKLINDVALKYPALIQGFDDYGNAILKVKGNVISLSDELDSLISDHADLQLDLRLGRIDEMSESLTNARSISGWMSRLFGGDDSLLGSVQKTTKAVEVLKNKLDQATTIGEKQNLWKAWSKEATKLAKTQNEINDYLEAVGSEFRSLGKLGADVILRGMGDIGESVNFSKGIKSALDMKKALFENVVGLTEIQKQAYASRALLMPLFESMGADIKEIFLGGIDVVVQGLQVKHFKQFGMRFKQALDAVNIGQELKDEIGTGIEEAISAGKSSIDLTGFFSQLNTEQITSVFGQMGQRQLAIVSEIKQGQGPALKQTLGFAKDYIIIRDETIKKEEEQTKKLKNTKENAAEVVQQLVKMQKMGDTHIQLSVSKTALDSLSVSLASLNKQWASFLKPIKQTFELLTKLGNYYSRLAKVQQTTVQLGEYGWRSQVKALEGMAVASSRVYGSMSGIFRHLNKDIKENFQNMEKVYDITARTTLVGYGIGAADRIRGSGFNEDTAQDVKIIAAQGNRVGLPAYTKEAKTAEGSHEASMSVRNRLLNDQLTLYQKADAAAAKYGKTLLDISYNGVQQGVYIQNSYTDQINKIDEVIQKTDKLAKSTGSRVGILAAEGFGKEILKVAFSNLVPEDFGLVGGNEDLNEQSQSLHAFQNRIGKILHDSAGDSATIIKKLGREFNEYSPVLDTFITKLDETGKVTIKNKEKYIALKKALTSMKDGYEALDKAVSDASKKMGAAIFTESFINNLKADVLYTKINSELKNKKIELGDINHIPILKSLQELRDKGRKFFKGKTFVDKDTFGLNILLRDMTKAGKEYAKLMEDLTKQTAAATENMMSASNPMEQLYHSMTITGKQAQQEYARTMKGLNIFTTITAQLGKKESKGFLKDIIGMESPEELRDEILRIFGEIKLPQALEAWKKQLDTNPEFLTDFKKLSGGLSDAVDSAGGDMKRGQAEVASKAQEAMAKYFQDNQSTIISMQDQLMKGVDDYQQYAQGVGSIARKQIKEALSIADAREIYATISASADKTAATLSNAFGGAMAGQVKNIRHALSRNLANSFILSSNDIKGIIQPVVKSLNISRYIEGENPYEGLSAKLTELAKEIFAKGDVDLTTPLEKLTLQGKAGVETFQELTDAFSKFMDITKSKITPDNIISQLSEIKSTPGKAGGGTDETKRLEKNIAYLKNLQSKYKEEPTTLSGQKEYRKEYYGIYGESAGKRRRAERELFNIKKLTEWNNVVQLTSKNVDSFQAKLDRLSEASNLGGITKGGKNLADILGSTEGAPKLLSEFIEKSDEKGAQSAFKKKFMSLMTESGNKEFASSWSSVWKYIAASAKDAKITEYIFNLGEFNAKISTAFHILRTIAEANAAKIKTDFEGIRKPYEGGFKKIWAVYREAGIDSTKEVFNHLHGGMKSTLDASEKLVANFGTLRDKVDDIGLKGIMTASLDSSIIQLREMKLLIKEIDDASKTSDTWDKLRKSINIVNAEVAVFANEFNMVDKTLGYVRSTLDDLLKTAINDGNKTLDEVEPKQREVIDSLAAYHSYLESLNDIYKSQVKGIDAMAESWKKVGAGAADAESPIYSMYKAMKEERFRSAIESIATRMKKALGQITPFAGIDALAKMGKEDSAAQMDMAFTHFGEHVATFKSAIDSMEEIVKVLSETSYNTLIPASMGHTSRHGLKEFAGGGKVDAPAGADMYSAKLSGQEMVLNPTQQMALEKSYPGASKYLNDMLPKWSPTGYAAGGLGSKKEVDVKPIFDEELLAMFNKEVNYRINDMSRPINFREKSSNASDYLTDAMFFSKFAVDMPGLGHTKGYATYKKLLQSNASSYLGDFSYLNKSLGANIVSGDTKKAQSIAEYIHNYYAKGIYHNPEITNLPELDGLDAIFTQYLVLRNQAGLKDFGIPQKKQETWKDVLYRKLAGFKELHRTGDISAGVFKQGERQHTADRNIPKFKHGGIFAAPTTGQEELTYKNIQQVGKRTAIKAHWTLRDIFDYLSKKDEETGDSMSARNLMLFSKFMGMIETGGAKLKPGIMQGAEYIKSAAGRGVAYAKEKFKGERRHQFGAVSGDEYPAYLHKGEVVLPEHMVYALNAANPGVFDGLQKVGAGPKSTSGSHQDGAVVSGKSDPGFWSTLGGGLANFSIGLISATADLSHFGNASEEAIQAQERVIYTLRQEEAKKAGIDTPTVGLKYDAAKILAKQDTDAGTAARQELKLVRKKAETVTKADSGAKAAGEVFGGTIQMAVLSGIESMIRSPEFGTQGMSLGDVTSGDQKFKKVDPALSKAMKQTMEVVTAVGGTAGQALGAATGIPGLDKVGQVLGEKLGALVGKWMTPKAVEDMAKAMDKFRKASLNAEAQLILMNFSIDTSSKVFSLINDTLTKATQEISNALSNFGNGLKDGTIRFLDVLDVYDSITASVSVGFNKVMDDISANSGKLTAKADTVTSSDMSVFGAVSEFFGTDVELTDMTPVYQELSDKIVAIGDATDDWFIGLKDNNSFMQILGGTFSGTGDILSQFGQALVGATEEIQMFTDVAVGGGVSEGQKLNLDAIRAPYIARLKGISTQMDTLDSQMGMFGGMADAAADAMDSFGKLDVTGKDETGVSAVVDAVGDFFFGTADEEQALLDQQNAQLEALALQTENEAAKLDIQTKQLELAKESAEIAEEMLSSLSDFITQINDSRMAASEQRKGWEYISGVVNGAGTDLTNFMDGLTGTGVTASSIISAAFGNTQATLMAEKVRSSRFATREEIESGAKGVTGQVYNKDGTVDVTKSLSVAKIQDYSSLASATGELVALSGEQITYLTSIAPEVASQVANMSVQELYYAVRDYQIDQGKKIADIYSRTNETIVEIAVTGYDNMLMTTSKYMSMMADTITRWSDENKFETEAIKTAIDEFSTQAEYIDPTAFMTTLGTNLGSSTASAFDTFNNMAKDTMPLLEEGAHGFLEITDTAKSFYSNQLQNMNTYINSLKSEKGINAALLRKQLDSFATGGAAGAGFTGGALTGSQLAALESNLGDDPIQRAAQMDTLMRLNDELVRIDSDILDKQNEAVDFARESTELLNKIQEDYAKSFGQPELEKQFIEMNLRLLRNMQHAVDPESGRLFMTEQGDLNRISMAENTALKNLGQGQFDVATTLEDFDQKYGAKIAGEGPRDVSTWTEVRPITNNIDIHLDMDFLDPSQLDTDRQRSIAIMVRDSLIDESARFSS